MAVGLVVAGYRYLREEAEREAAADAAAAALGPSADECVLIRDMFDRWVEGDRPLVMEPTARLTAAIVAGPVAAGQEFAAGLETLPAQKARELREALRGYNDAVTELSAALSTGPASDAQAQAVWTARTQVYEQNGDLEDRYCE